jgi:hypothetical protein
MSKKLNGKAKAKARAKAFKTKELKAAIAKKKNNTITIANIQNTTSVELYQSNQVHKKATGTSWAPTVFAFPEGMEATDHGMFIANLAYYAPDSQLPDFTGNTNKGVNYVSATKMLDSSSRKETMHHIEVGKGRNGHLLQITVVGWDGSKKQHIEIISQAIKSVPSYIAKEFANKECCHTITDVKNVGIAA